MAPPEDAVAGGDPSVASPPPVGQALPAVFSARGGGIRPGRVSSQRRPAAASRANKARGGPRRASATAKKAVKTADPSPLERLVLAIRADDQPAFDALVQTAELDVNRRTPHGDTALVEACRYARLDMVAVLLHGRQASVNLTASNRDANRVGLSPLIAACMALQPALVDMLLQQPARVSVLQNFGRVNAALVCVIFCVANGRTDEQNERALAILEMLLRYAKKHAQLGKLLGAKPDKVNHLLHVAAALGNWRVLELLRTHEDEFEVDFFAHNALGHSALHVVEHNAFQARSLQFCEPPRPDTAGSSDPKRKGGKQERNTRKRRQRNRQQVDKDEEQKNEDDEALRQEPQSEAGALLRYFTRGFTMWELTYSMRVLVAPIDKQTFTRSRPNRTVEAFHVTRTVMELTKTTGNLNSPS
ncbi:hypothetical protein BBJ28_00006233 [Nothophytophthora sp. Chile5]|nr:hypothetical protein BBJ28_00006233 [Nothophytophthora sp. Chile5]